MFSKAITQQVSTHIRKYKLVRTVAAIRAPGTSITEILKCFYFPNLQLNVGTF